MGYQSPFAKPAAPSGGGGGYKSPFSAAPKTEEPPKTAPVVPIKKTPVKTTGGLVSAAQPSSKGVFSRTDNIDPALRSNIKAIGGTDKQVDDEFGYKTTAGMAAAGVKKTFGDLFSAGKKALKSVVAAPKKLRERSSAIFEAENPARVQQAKKDLGKNYIPEVREQMKKSGGLVASVAQSVPRAAASLGLDLAAKGIQAATGKTPEGVYSPKGKAEQAVFGKEPIKGIGTKIVENQPKIKTALASAGVNDKAAGFAAGPLAFAGSVGMTALDLAGGESSLVKKGLEKSIIKATTKEAAEQVAKKMGMEATGEIINKIIKTADKGGAKKLIESAPAIVHAAEIKGFERIKGLSKENTDIQEKSIEKYVKNKQAMVDEYIAKFGNTANADDARKLFVDVGYTGSNSAAVHEAASALNKEAWKTILKNSKSQDAYLYAGGPGSGKGTAIKNILSEAAQKDPTLDGVMSKYDSAIKNMGAAIEAGKNPKLVAVYRDPVEAFTDGVVKRMLNNKEEAGRLVPIRTVAEGHVGAFKTVKKIADDFRSSGKEGRVLLINNAQGPGKASKISIDEWNKLNMPSNLEELLAAEVDRLYKLPDGSPLKITKQQRDAFLEGSSFAKSKPEAVSGKTTPPSAGPGLPTGPGAATAQELPQKMSSYSKDSTKIAKSQGSLVNLDRIGVSDEGKRLIEQASEDIRPQVESAVGKTLTNKEVMDLAEKSSKALNQEIGREQTLKMGAQALNLRNELAAAAEAGKVTPEFIEFLKRDKEFSSNIARLLEQRKITSAPKNTMEEIISNILEHNDNLDEILKAADGVDFNDAEKAAEFYRQFVQPKATEWIDLLRYNSMLSSPLTHIINIFSNLQNSAIVAPLEKLAASGIDLLSSKMTGKERQMFAGEAGQFLKGYVQNVGDGFRSFANVMSGKAAMTNLDLRNIPLATKGAKGVAVKALSFPMRLLEGMDQFFTTMTYGGELKALQYRAAKGVKSGNLEAQAAEKAMYRLYRQDLHSAGQGPVLDALDTMTGLLMQARNSKNPILSTIAKFTVPFVKTPMNIFKQGIEYSPLGVSTVIGAKNKTEQLAKAAIGSSVFAGAATLLASNRTTWGEPVSTKEKNNFRAAGMQPYSMKIGDTWVSYQKLAPAIAFPFAMVSAINDLQKNKKIDDTTTELVLAGIAKYGQFLSDQSYAKSVGDLLSAAKGGEAGIARVISNYPTQLIPYRAMTGWLARLSDATQRQVDSKAAFVDKQIQLLMMNYPGLSQKVPARLDSAGRPVENKNRLANAVSPVRTSEEDVNLKKLFDTEFEIKKQNQAEKVVADQKKVDMKTTYDQLKQLADSGKKEEANAAIEKMSDEDYKAFRSIMRSEKAKQDLVKRADLMPAYESIKQLVEAGKKEEANKELEALSDEDYAALWPILKKLKTDE